MTDQEVMRELLEDRGISEEAARLRLQDEDLWLPFSTPVGWRGTGAGARLMPWQIGRGARAWPKGTAPIVGAS